jgi:hypothetical protein
MSEISFLLILDRVLLKYDLPEVAFRSCSNNDELKNLIQFYKQRKIILICRAEHIQESCYSNIKKNDIHEVFILGNYSGPCFSGIDIRMVNTNEEDLKYYVLCAASDYMHKEEIIQRELKDFGEAERRSKDFLELLEEIQKLLQACTKKF